MDRGLVVAAVGGLAVAAIALGAGTAHAAPAGPPGTPPGGGGTPSACGTLDAGIDATTAAAVCQAIASATSASCSSLASFASSIAAKYPMAAALLTAKAAALGCTTTPPATNPANYQPGVNILPQMSAAIENDVCYALGTFLNGSGVLTNSGVLATLGASGLAFWTPPSSGGGASAPAPFPLESGILYVTAAQVAAGGASGWVTPTSWPPYMTQQAVDCNNSSAPDGVYYVCDSAPGGSLWQMTKSGGNTTLMGAGTVTNWAAIPGGPGYVPPGGGGAPSTLQTLLGNLANLGEAVDALQLLGNLSGFSVPAGLPGSQPGVLDGQTFLTLVAWLTAQGLSAVLAGTDSGVLGSMQGALPGFIQLVKSALGAS
jgi:hypothetical protein